MGPKNRSPKTSPMHLQANLLLQPSRALASLPEEMTMLGTRSQHTYYELPIGPEKSKCLGVDHHAVGASLRHVGTRSPEALHRRWLLIVVAKVQNSYWPCAQLEEFEKELT